MFVGYRGRKIEYIAPSPIYSGNMKYLRVEGDLNKLSPEYIREHFEVLDDRLTPKPKKKKIAMVSSYGTNCGMSTYCKYLAQELQPLASELRIFAEYSATAAPEDNVIRCWDRENGIYQDVIAKVTEYEPDIVYIQHEYGIFKNPAQWNVLVGHLTSMYRTVVVLHSVYDHADKLVFEAPCKEIIVHSPYARDLLIKKGIDHAVIHYIPHGCVLPKKADLKFSSMRDQHVIFQFGFGFEYKGWSNVNDIIAGLKQDFSDVTYVGVFNTSQYYLAMNNLYYDRLMAAIRDKKLEGNVVLHKGFRSEEVLFSYMEQAKINIFPYWNHPEWMVHGASGAVRLALASGTPTIVGDVPFFYEFKGYLPVCKTQEEYLTEITKIFRDPTYKTLIQKRMADFIEERTWDKVASWYLECQFDTPFSAPLPEVSK